MKSNVVYYILLLLDSENTVRIPGLGAITRKVKPAEILTKERSVNPPSATVDFTPSSKNKGKLLARYISYKSGIGPEAATSHVEEFASTVKANLRESGKVSIDYLGVFYQRGSKISFDPNGQTVNAAYSGLKNVELPTKISQPKQEVTASVSTTAPVQEGVNNLSELVPDENPKLPLEAKAVQHAPVVSIDEGESATSTIQSEETHVPKIETSKKRRRVPLLLPIFLAIFLGVTALAIMQYNKRDAIYHPASTYNRAPAEDKPLFGSGEESKAELAVPSDDLTTTAGDDKTLTEVFSDDARKLLGVEETGEIVDAEDPLIEEYDSSQESLSSEESLMTDDEVSSDPDLMQSTPQTDLEDGQESFCYVIVGAFGVQSNVDRMLTRLADMGYNPASMPRKNLTQIGVPAPCGSAEIQNILVDLQQNVEAEAWIFNK